MQNEKKRVGTAFLLGMLAIAITAYASHVTTSTVMWSETFHNTADTVGILLLLIVVHSKGNTAAISRVGNVSNGLLFLAGAISLSVGLYGTFVIQITGAEPIKNPFTLLLVSMVALPIIWVQLKLLGNMHHIIHACDHDRGKADYFTGSGQGLSLQNIEARRKGSGLGKAHTAAVTELGADLVQACFGVVMGLIALYIDNGSFVRYADVFLSIMLGIWMIARSIQSHD